MTSTLRNLTELKLAVARIENSASNMGLKQISEFPLATERTKKYQFPLYCDLTGIHIGSIATINVAGHSPYLGQWKNTQARHPVFSIPIGARLKLARESYLRFCALDPSEIASLEIVQNQEQLLQVLTVAMLHELTEVKQDCIWLPTFATVTTVWNSLLSLSYWKLYLESQRFKFPAFRVFADSADSDLTGFLQACWERKKEYERNVSAAITEEEHRRMAEAERIMLRIRDDIAGKRPMSSKLLWRWFEQNMPPRYKKDIEGWMKDIFFATEKTIHDNTIRDVELFAEMAAAELPLGSSISHAFFEILNSKKSLLTTYYRAYEMLDDDDFDASDEEATLEEATTPELPEPRKQDFTNLALYLKAKANWQLSRSDRTKHRKAAMAKQQEATVKPTFIPELPWMQDEDDSDATEQFLDNFEREEND